MGNKRKLRKNTNPVLSKNSTISRSVRRVQQREQSGEKSGNDQFELPSPEPKNSGNRDSDDENSSVILNSISFENDPIKYFKYFHLICSCEHFYDKMTYPCLLSSGENLCTVCFHEEKQKYCSYNDVGRVKEKTKVNKDLVANSLLISEAIKMFYRSPSTEVLESDVAVDDDLHQEVTTEYIALKNISKVSINQCKNHLKTMQKAFSCCEYIMRILREVTLRILNFGSVDNFSKDLEMNVTQIHQCNEKMSQIDMCIIESLVNTTKLIDKSILMGLRVPEIVLQPNILHTLFKENVCVYATLLSRNKRRLWSLIKFFPTYFSTCSIDTKMRTENNHVILIEYDFLPRTYINYGMFFELQFKNNVIRTLYIRLFVGNSKNISNQIKKLCIGEEGPTYKGGAGFSTQERIVISSYINNKQQCYNDYQYILESSPPRQPKKGMVSTTREYGREAEIMISLKDESFEREIIGELLYHEMFNDIPCTAFSILDCGLTYEY